MITGRGSTVCDERHKKRPALRLAMKILNPKSKMLKPDYTEG
jgi:hypothetical protein